MSHERPTSSDQKVNQKRYESNYVRIFGTLCKACDGRRGHFSGWDHVLDIPTWVKCPNCDGAGYVEK